MIQTNKLVACQIGILIILVVSFVACGLMIFQGLSGDGLMGFAIVFLFVPRLPRVFLTSNHVIDARLSPLNRYEDMLEGLSLCLFILLLSLKVLHYLLA